MNITLFDYFVGQALASYQSREIPQTTANMTRHAKQAILQAEILIHELEVHRKEGQKALELKITQSETQTLQKDENH